MTTPVLTWHSIETRAVLLRLGRDRIEDDLAAIRAVREGVGDAVESMVDFNQGLTMDQALIRCHAIDGQGLTWIEEPVAYDNINSCA
jgi:mandelate racemase